MRMLVIVLLLAIPLAAQARNETFTVQWQQICQTVPDASGVSESLDSNGDGICDLLSGFRLYTEAGEFITGIPEDGSRQYTWSYNVPWGERCHYMTAVMDDPTSPGAVLESDPSNIGACKVVRPGKPQPPNVTN